MTRPLLETKFYVPRPRRRLIARPRLIERLNQGAESKLILISAPAGFGKTTLLAAWLAASPDGRRTAAWLSLEQSDNQPTSFWTYLIGALQTVAPGVGVGALSTLQSTQPPIEVVLASLLNDLSALSYEIVLVLDDYHVVDASDVHDGVVFLLDHLPPQLHLVITSRADPPLRLARLRARGELAEIRAGDLRFTPDEAATYFNEVMGLDLEAREIAVLESRTEGWIAALQLAALSMQGRRDVADFVAAFAGDDRYIVDYLVEEVLQRQPERIRGFLLQTSVLETLSAALCNAVTRQDDGKAMLEALERGNLFVVPLDDRRRWYRYHHLFRDVLRAHLIEERPDDVAELHRRASEWYEQNGERPEAIRHALAARDFGRAADLVELAWPALRRNRQEAMLRGWLAALPDELLRNRPVLSNAYAGVLLVSGELDGVDARLRDAERWLDASEAPRVQAAGIVVVDEEEFRRLPGSVALHRAGHALALGNLAETAKHARRALDHALEDDHLSRGGATAILGLAAWAIGDLETAHRTYAAGMAGVQRAGHISGLVGRAITLADIRIAQGRLCEALRTYEHALQLATEQDAGVLGATADMYVGMSELHCERNDLDAATQDLRKSHELGEQSGFPQNRYRWRVAMARILEARGDLDGALDLLHEAEPLYMSDLSPNVRPIAALKARVNVRQGRVGEAVGWAREQGLATDDDLSYLREFEHITLARLLLARGSVSEATQLLERLLRAADEGARNGSVIEILVLQALAYQMRGNNPAALVPLERALRLAEPEGYVRMFVDEGPPMAALLEAAAKRGIAAEYARQLLKAFGKAEDRSAANQVLIEPLSERELDVLRLLGTDLVGPEIASQLMVSLNTVRTHIKSIYTKLGVNNRRTAVRRAEELELLARSQSQ